MPVNDIRPKEYSFTTMMSGVINDVMLNAEGLLLRFIVNVDCGIPDVLFGDGKLISEVLTGVMYSAVKHAPRGVLSLTVYGDLCDNDIGTVLITCTVFDTGEPVLERIKTDKDDERNLSAAKEILEAMGGNILFPPPIDNGNTVTLVIPQKIIDAPTIIEVFGAEKKRVLVYERRETYGESISCLLGNLGVSSRYVSDEGEFRECMASGQYDYAVLAIIFYEDVKEICTKLEERNRLALVAAYGHDTLGISGLNVIKMPLFSADMAEFLNN
jgi:hypothetical protein